MDWPKSFRLAGLTEPAFDDLGMFDLGKPKYNTYKDFRSKALLTEEDGKIKATVAGNAEGFYIKNKRRSLQGL